MQRDRHLARVGPTTGIGAGLLSSTELHYRNAAIALWTRLAFPLGPCLDRVK
jgi:hypothetical protein